jgi:hypothetical protein
MGSLSEPRFRAGRVRGLGRVGSFARIAVLAAALVFAAAQQMRLPVFDPELDREGIELEAELTAKYGIIEEAPAYEDLVGE